jgi:hypothetical protein
LVYAIHIDRLQEIDVDRAVKVLQRTTAKGIRLAQCSPARELGIHLWSHYVTFRPRNQIQRFFAADRAFNPDNHALYIQHEGSLTENLLRVISHGPSYKGRYGDAYWKLITGFDF